MSHQGYFAPRAAGAGCGGANQQEGFKYGAAAGYEWGLQADHVASAGDLAVMICGDPLFLSATGLWQAHAEPAAAVLRAYRQDGDRMLQSVGGRFALAVIDAARRRALLAIDPMGIERMAYSVADERLTFGSSAEWVARATARPPAIDRDALLDYLMLHMVPSPGTIFKAVSKLPAGACLVFESGKHHVRRYANMHFHESGGIPSGSFEQYKAELFDGLRQGIAASAPGVASGAFLSGGLDSSTVAGLLSETTNDRAKTFTIGFGYADYDEFPFSRAANARFNCDGSEYVITAQDIADGFGLIASAYDEPFGNSSALPVYYCAKFARQHGVDRLLAGDGGDELFAGNTRYAEQEVFERYSRVPQFLRTGLIEPALRAWPHSLDVWLTRKARGYIAKANTPLPGRLESWNLLQKIGLEKLLDAAFLGTIDRRHTVELLQAQWDAAPASTALSKMLCYDWQFTLADNDLRKVSTMSELAGVGVSYPMLHPAVVDLSMRLPNRMKMPGTQLRKFYKRAVAGFLPDEIIHKKKHGFSLPFGLWLQVSPELRTLIHDNLRALRQRGIINPAFIDRLLDLHNQEDSRYYGVFIWVLAMLEQWLQEHRLGV